MSTTLEEIFGTTRKHRRKRNPTPYRKVGPAVDWSVGIARPTLKKKKSVLEIEKSAPALEATEWLMEV